VQKFTRREQDRIMHSRESLKDVSWLVDPDGDLIPQTFCDVEYLEQAFNHDQAFWLRTLGALNPSEMEEKLVNAPRRMLPDSEFYKVVADTVNYWFKTELSQLTIDKKKRIIPYLWRTRKTTVNQLARTFDMDRVEVRNALRLPKSQGETENE